MPFKDFLAYVYEMQGESIKDTTKECYVNYSKQIVKELGDIKIGDITEDDCRRFINNLPKKKHKTNGVSEYYAKKSIHKVYVILGVVIEYAARKKLIEADFMEYIDEPLSNKTPVKKNKAFVPEDKEKILVAVADDIQMNAFVRISMDTGIRPSEIIALHKEDIDFENKTIDINKTISKKFNVDFKKLTTKKVGVEILPIKNDKGGDVDKSRRVLSLNDETLKAVKAHINAVEKDKALVKKEKKMERVRYCLQT
ncbi:MAG: hypothetical protein A2Y24_04710 [Clostridiales bacterium GWE2_32_10]|nr:MAG: hypothetical protein A2Y24_04710 [Clostridiales bacterium GWE2_32_10]